MKKRPVTVFLISLAMFLAIVPFFNDSALGQKYPTKPVEILVPYAGGSMEIISRLLANITPKYLGQPLVVVLKPGGVGSVAAAEVISSKPDGYKLYCQTDVYWSFVSKMQKIPFDPYLLTPLVNLVAYKQGLAVRSDSPWKTLNDLLEYGKKNPGKIKWGHSGRGLVQHMAVTLIFRKAGIKTIDIPYKAGLAETVVSLLGGHVDAVSIMYPAVQDHVKAGKVRFLAVFGDQRYTDAPDVPNIVELGYPEVAELTPYMGYYIHRDTPEEIRRTLFDAFKKTYEEPQFRTECEKLGELLKFEGPESIKEKIKKSEEIGVPVLKELGLYVER